MLSNTTSREQKRHRGRRDVLRKGGVLALTPLTGSIASGTTAAQPGQGGGKWHVEIRSADGGTTREGIVLAMPTRAAPGRGRHASTPSEPGPPAFVHFDGPVTKERTIQPGVSYPVLFEDPGTYHATARPRGSRPGSGVSNENAAGAIAVRGPNPLTITE